MPRKPRDLQPGYCYHITVRCNSRKFYLIRHELKDLLLSILKDYQAKYGFKLYGLCIMSNHVHYLLEPKHPEDLPKLMHDINWKAAMCCNVLLNQSGHFWEKRYHSAGFPKTDDRRMRNTLRYIHANPKAAGMQQGFFYDHSNYGSYDRLTDDGLTQWALAFLTLGTTLELCAEAYRKFCKKYKPQPKPERKNHWGSKKLAGLKPIKKSRKNSPGQLNLWAEWQIPLNEIQAVAKKFIGANCFDPQRALERFPEDTS